MHGEAFLVTSSRPGSISFYTVAAAPVSAGEAMSGSDCELVEAATVPSERLSSAAVTARPAKRGRKLIEDWNDGHRADLSNTGNVSMPAAVTDTASMLFYACHRAGLVDKRPSDEYKMMCRINHGVIQVYQVRKPGNPVATASVQAVAPPPMGLIDTQVMIDGAVQAEKRARLSAADERPAAAHDVRPPADEHDRDRPRAAHTARRSAPGVSAGACRGHWESLSLPPGLLRSSVSPASRAETQELGASPGSPASRAETPVDLDATQPVDLDATQPVESQPAGGLLLIGPCDRTAGPQHNPFSNACLRWSTFDFSLRW